MGLSGTRIADSHLFYKLIEIMESTPLGFARGDYTILDGFPNVTDLNTDQIWPTITVELDSMFGNDIELGSNAWPTFIFSVDVLANTDSQRDDISYELWEALNDGRFILHSFDTAYPDTSGAVDYTRCSAVGTWGVGEVGYMNIHEDKNSTIKGLKHHSLLDGILQLPIV